MKNIVIFASGTGSNAENIIRHFQIQSFKIAITVFTNNSDAKVVERVKKQNIPTIIFTKSELNEGFVLQKLQDLNPNIIVLAGFLLKFPISIIEKFPDKIINIHPSLLPKHGGKGMYGKFVHEAVLINKEKETGITIHYVNEHYDEGEYIFQKAVNIEDCKSIEEIAKKVHTLEHEFLPKIIENLLFSKY